MVSFPHDFLSAQTLTETLRLMHQSQRYNQILFYLEACESGSMFQDLAGDINVLAFTASNATAPSFACYYDDNLETFLADVFRYDRPGTRHNTAEVFIIISPASAGFLIPRVETTRQRGCWTR